MGAAYLLLFTVLNDADTRVKNKGRSWVGDLKLTEAGIATHLAKEGRRAAEQLAQGRKMRVGRRGSARATPAGARDPFKGNPGD